MTTTKVKSVAKTAAKTTKKVTSPAKAIGDAAVGLERDIVSALRKEIKNLTKMLETIEHDVRTAIDRVERALESSTGGRRSGNAGTAAAGKKPAATAAKARAKTTAKTTAKATPKPRTTAKPKVAAKAR